MTISSTCAAGDVVEIEFPYSFGDGAKQRPALVVSGPSTHGDYTFIMISKEQHDDGVAINASDFAAGSLKATSFVRVSRLFTIDGEHVVTKRGRLKPAAMDRVMATLCPSLGCKC